MEKGNSKKEMLERFGAMGIPKPLVPIANPPKTSADPEKQSKMDQIRNGALKNQYAKFIEKSEKSSGPVTLKVPKVGKNPNEAPSENVPQLESFAPKKSAEALALEAAMYGDVSSSNTTYTSKEINEDYGANDSIDIRARLRARLESKQSESQSSFGSGISSGINLTEAELTEKIMEISTEVATEISKRMIKTVLVEYAKSGKGIIMESKTVRKAEIVDRNKVKIGGKVYKLIPVKE